jgi:hypothetical protein
MDRRRLRSGKGLLGSWVRPPRRPRVGDGRSDPIASVTRLSRLPRTDSCSAACSVHRLQDCIRAPSVPPDDRPDTGSTTPVGAPLMHPRAKQTLSTPSVKVDAILSPTADALGPTAEQPGSGRLARATLGGFGNTGECPCRLIAERSSRATRKGARTAVDTSMLDSHTARLLGANTQIISTPMASPAVTKDAVSHVSNASSDVALRDPWTIRTSSAATMGK